MDSFEFNKIAAAILIALLTIKGADLIANASVQPKVLKENAFKIAGASSAELVTSVPLEKQGLKPIEPLLAATQREGNRIPPNENCTNCHGVDRLHTAKKMGKAIPHAGSWLDFKEPLK